MFYWLFGCWYILKTCNQKTFFQNEKQINNYKKMKSIIIYCILLLSFTSASAQEYENEKIEIKTLIEEFRESIIKKDTATFLNLFYEDSVNWIGVIKNKSQAKRLEFNPGSTKNYFIGSYRNFAEGLLKKEKKEEIFENVKIINDDVIGSVSSDYSFLSEDKMTNYGKEFWLLIKVNGKWKITSLIYSIENANLYPKQ